MNRIILIFYCFGIWMQGQAQDGYLRQLNQELEKASDIQAKNKIRLKLADWYYSDDLQEHIPKVLEQLIVEAEGRQLVEAYTKMARYYRWLEEPALSKTYIDSAYIVAAPRNISAELALIELTEGDLLEYLDDRDKAHSLYLQALGHLEKHPNEAELKAYLYYKFFLLFMAWNQLEEAEKHLDLAIKEAEKVTPKNLLAMIYGGKALIYSYYLDDTKAIADRDKMFGFSEKSMQMAIDFPGEIAAGTQANNLINEANYYLRYVDSSNPDILEKIHSNLDAAFIVLANKSNNESNLASGYGMLSSMAINAGNYEQAENYLLHAHSIMLGRKKPNHRTMINVVKALAHLYELKEDYKNAYKYEKDANLYSRQLFNEEASKTAKKQEALYQFEKQEEEIRVLMEQSEWQRKQKLIYIGLFVVTIIGAFFMFRSYHLNLKYSLAREKQSKAEQKETEIQLKFKHEEQNRLRAEQELLALKQQQLHDEIMANELQLQHKNEVLQHIKEKLKSDKTLNINQLIKEETWNDHNFEDVKFQISKLHPNFFNNLKERAEKKLSQLDLKYCAYFYLNMETKQIAQLLGVAPKSIRVTKYRLKKKFNLPPEVDLLEFIKDAGQGSF